LNLQNNRWLIFILIFLQILDFESSIIGARNGASEGNQVLIWLATLLGSIFFTLVVVKISLIAVLIGCVNRLKNLDPWVQALVYPVYSLISLFYLIVILNNHEFFTKNFFGNIGA